MNFNRLALAKNLQSSLFLLVFIFFAQTASFGQFYTRTNCNDPYVQIQGLTGTTLIARGDDVTTTRTLPFTFNYFCNNYTQINITNNGVIMFLPGTQRGFTNATLPTAIAGAAMCPFWDDLDSGSGTLPDALSGVYERVDGVAPNRIYTIEWYRNGHFNEVANQHVTFQVKLYETSNQFKFQYLDVFFGGTQTAFDRGLSATVGIENVVGAPREFSLLSFNTSFLNDGDCFLFTPPPPACPGFMVQNITVGMAPGTCEANVNLSDYISPRGCVATFTPPGPTFPGGVTNVTAVNGCITLNFTVTVQDVEPPVIVGCPKAVILNLGPGECEASWDAPPLMAMDNCPGTNFSGPVFTSPGCPNGANNFLTATTFYIGLMFNIQNTSSQLMAVKGLSFMPNNQFGNVYRIYTTTNPGPYLPVANNAAAWTQVANDMVKIGQTGFPAPNPRLLIQFDLTTPIILTPGEERGMAIYGGGLGITQYYVNGVAPCSTTLQGDANLKIDVRTRKGSVWN